MIPFDEIKKYLPQYLSDSSQENLFEELKNFPDNIDQRFYSEFLTRGKMVYQGDGLIGMLVVNLPDNKTETVPAMVLSNTCDIDPANKRIFPTRMVYAPIFDIEKYKQALIRDHVDTGRYPLDSIEAHIDAVKKQFISHIFYLPKGCGLIKESIVFLDRLNNGPLKSIGEEDIADIKLFTLSDYGFYVFLIKLSIHFTRIREGIERPFSAN
jgi:hypothetical protein